MNMTLNLVRLLARQQRLLLAEDAETVASFVQQLATGKRLDFAHRKTL